MTFAAHDWVDYNARHRPGALALANAEDGTSTTWAELDSRVGRLARVLREHGVKKGDRVALIAENDPRVFETQFAAMRLGALFMPSIGAWRWQRSPTSSSTPTPRSSSTTVSGRAWRPPSPRSPESRRGSPGVPTLPPEASYEDEIASARYLGASGALTFDDPTHLLYTSGTAGKPKGVLSTHGTLVWQAINTAHTTRYAEPGNHQLNPMPLFHAGGLTVMANPILYFGGAVTTMRRFVPAAVLRALTASKVPVTHFAAIPLMYRGLAAEPDFASVDFSHARTFIVAGAIAEPDLLQLWADRGSRCSPSTEGRNTVRWPRPLTIPPGGWRRRKTARPAAKPATPRSASST